MLKAEEEANVRLDGLAIFRDDAEASLAAAREKESRLWGEKEAELVEIGQKNPQAFKNRKLTPPELMESEEAEEEERKERRHSVGGAQKQSTFGDTARTRRHDARTAEGGGGVLGSGSGDYLL